MLVQLKKTETTWNLLSLSKWLVVALGILGLDQCSKYWVQQYLAPGESNPITSFFNLVIAYNRGAAFSFLADASGWQRPFFATVALLIALFICVMLAKHWKDKWFCLALTLVLGGALGNAVDRIFIGHVVDFLDFHAMGYHWPAFNIADIAICCGAILVVLIEFSRPKH